MDRPRSARGRAAGDSPTGGRVVGCKATIGRVVGCGVTIGRVVGRRVIIGRVVGCRLATGRIAGRLAPLCAGAVLASITLAACGSGQVSGAASGAASPTVAATVAGSSTAGSPAAGSPGATSPGPTATQAPLCRDTVSVTGLEIVRNQVARVPVLRIALPGQVTVSSPARARAVARALCALPPMPHGVFNCPALLVGTTYLLRFSAGGRRLPPVTIEATGCELVTGAGPTRWVATSPGFWRVLATAAHLRPPGWPAFSGGSHRGPICDPIRREQVDGCPALVQPGGAAVP